MTIWVNQEAQEYPAPLSLDKLLQQLGKADKTGIAVAVNNQVISKSSWVDTTIQNQDKITIITATQGG